MNILFEFIANRVPRPLPIPPDDEKKKKKKSERQKHGPWISPFLGAMATIPFY